MVITAQALAGGIAELGLEAAHVNIYVAIGAVLATASFVWWLASQFSGVRRVVYEESEKQSARIDAEIENAKVDVLDRIAHNRNNADLKFQEINELLEERFSIIDSKMREIDGRLREVERWQDRHNN